MTRVPDLDRTNVPRPARTIAIATVAGALALGAGALLLANRAAPPEFVDAAASDDTPASDIPEAAEPRFAAPGEPARSDTGLLGQAQSSAVATPYGGAFAVGNDDEDVWGGLSGTEVGEVAGTAGLGLVGTGRGGGGTGEATIGLGSAGMIGSSGRGFGSGFGRGTRWRESAMLESASGDEYAHVEEAGFVAIADDAKSTFGVDVDTASYTNVRRFLDSGQLPPADAVRIEEMINYFDYDLDRPSGGKPFAVESEVATCPWAKDHLLVKLALQGESINPEDAPARNMVFLMDVSGSMSGPDRLPLLRDALELMVDRMRPQDRVAIVVYAGASGIVLDSQPGTQKARIRAALKNLESGGSTNGGAGIELAYRVAERNFIEGGSNRVILATDGDFNVGVQSHKALVKLIESKRDSGVFLSVLGVGRGNLDDDTMEALADKGNGHYAYLDSLGEARRVLADGATGTTVTIAKDVKIQVEFDPDEVASWRLIGYENRKLAHADFDDDRKDAGEIGAGHSVTALYEIVPRRGERTGDGTLMNVALRYKLPAGDTSTLLTHDVSADPRSLASASDDLRFAAAVAQFGMLLRNSSHRGTATWASTVALADGASGESGCSRGEFVRLASQAAKLAGAGVKTVVRESCRS
ncbi:MAG: VWA domain-containing protein [Nannocystaceae bacterium]|nr:VWA domain-containing protein [Nannocystaceae bacterium]